MTLVNTLLLRMRSRLVGSGIIFLGEWLNCGNFDVLAVILLNNNNLNQKHFRNVTYRNTVYFGDDTMKKLLVFCTLSLLIFGFAADTSPRRATYTAHIEDNSRLFIEGSSNINTFECNSRDKTAPISFGFMLNDKGDTIRLTNAMLQLRTKNLDCDNSKMNADLCDAMKAEQYPTIKIDLLGAMTVGGANFEDVERDWKPLKVLANLTITNVTKRVVLDVKARKIDGNKYRFVSVKDVRMTDYNVQPPEVMLGMIKVNNLIKLNIDITARLTKE
jgi:hypothetical protein